MRNSGGRRGERGTASVEMALSLVWIVFVMVFLIGMGHTLINRQKALVGARFAAFHESGKAQRPPHDVVRRAVHSPETWTVVPSYENDSAGTREKMGGGALGVVTKAVDTVLGWIGADGTLKYESSVTPTVGLLPRMFRLRATADYTLANDTWTCEKGATYLEVVSKGIPYGDKFLKLGCCNCYPKR